MSIFKSKTINTAMLVGVFGALEQNLPLVREQLGDYYGWLFMGVAVAMAGLRAVTNKPLAEK